MPLIPYFLIVYLPPLGAEVSKKDRSFIYFVTVLSPVRLHGLAHTDDQ